MKILKAITITSLIALPTALLANTCENTVLDKINYDISSEKSIESKDAKVIVKLNATVTPDDLASVQSTSKSELEKITDSKDWKIDTYNQNKTNNGLVDVYITFTNRLGSTDISELTSKIDSLNKSGNKFAIQNIDYTPSLSQYESAENELRLEILASISKQVKALNAQQDDKYSIHKVSFYSQQNNAPKPMLMMARMNDSAGAENSAYNENMNISTDVQIKANIELAKENSFSCDS